MKVADVAPSGTETVAGTVAFLVSLLRSVIDSPPAGAAQLKMIVPVEVAGAVTVVGLRVRFVSAVGGITSGGGGAEVVAEAVFDKAERLPAASTANTV